VKIFQSLLFLEPLFDKAGNLAYFIGSQFPLSFTTQPEAVAAHANNLVCEIAALLNMSSELQAARRVSLAKNSAAAVRLWLYRP
jgi:hypothetical protein